ICVKGAFVFKGYYKEAEKTKETIDDEGYVLTGDVGEWLPNGQLKIIDRVKHIFKLSQGEYVAPECVENEYIRTEGVAQIFVHGESLQDCCVAIVVPDEEWSLG
ncbi:putative long-chain-fatty-acid--CoA ligase 1-like isoform X2, partial [Apostichopus japonicus]